MPGKWYYVLTPMDLIFLMLTLRLFFKVTNLQLAMLPVLVLGSIRLIAYLSHQIYLCEVSPVVEDVGFALEMTYAWFVLFNILMFQYLLFFLEIMKSLFKQSKPIKALAALLGLVGAVALLTGIALIFVKYLTFKMGIIITTGLVPIAIIYALYYYKNQAFYKFYKDTEERTR